jgi:hypothetical protein
MTINRDPRIAADAMREKKASETKKALKRASKSPKQGPGPHPTLDGIKRRKGQPEPASKH